MDIPSWGRVVARPHEFLVHIRRGRVKTTGHGASCFKWPSDSVALLSTSIAKLAFTADQVTREKVGVEVTGLAVYRIAEPMIAFRMIDGELARLTEILRDMFVGATRRIVASLSLDECITHRKERVASALMEEVAPVLAGHGELGDATGQGWGVVLDTIEIQNVRVLSEEVFQRLQAPYREELSLRALRAREGVAEEQARISLARRRAEEAANRAIMSEEETRLAAERAREAEAIAHQSSLASAALEGELARAAHKERAEVERLRRASEAKMEHQRREAELALALERERLALRREQGELEVSLAKLTRDARAELTERQLEEVMLTDTLPKMAQAMRGSFGQIQLTTAGGAHADLFSFLSAGLEQVVRATRSASRELSRPAPQPEPDTRS